MNCFFSTYLSVRLPSKTTTTLCTYLCAIYAKKDVPIKSSVFSIFSETFCDDEAYNLQGLLSEDEKRKKAKIANFVINALKCTKLS